MITADRFGGFGADETDAEGGAEVAEGSGDVPGDFSEDMHANVDLFSLGLAAVRALRTVPAGKGSVGWASPRRGLALSPWLQIRPT